MQSNRSNSLNQSQPVKRISLIQTNSLIDPLKNTMPNQENSEYKYLPPVKPIHQELSDPKWQEYKIEGKNIHNRAYSSITINDNYLYLYGGYQVSIGIMKDFYRMNISGQSFQWEPILTKGKETPGFRTRHTLCTYQNQIFMFGGQSQQSISTNQMWVYSIDQNTWSKRKITPSYPPELDNHSACLYNKDGKTYWMIFGGFFGEQIGLHSNYVFQYDFESNEWKKLFPSQQAEQQAPTPRDGAGMAIISDRLYVFGGSNGHERFNDLWSFNIAKQSWNYIQVKNQLIPKVRSGHSLNSFGNKLVLFGGIHDITWELDDLYNFDIEKGQWEIIDEDSARRKDNQPVSPSKEQGSFQLNNNWVQSRFYSVKKRNLSYNNRKSSSKVPSRDPSPTKMQDKSQSEFSIENHQSKINMTLAQAHQRTLEEKKKKELLAKKMNMLKLFEINDKEHNKFDIHSPTSEAMKNSLMVIGNPKSDLKIKPGRLTEFGKPTYSRFLQPLNAMENSIIGKRPCARDGHCTISIGKTLVIFGGDRHQMSFNDVHALDMSGMKPLPQLQIQLQEQKELKINVD